MLPATQNPSDPRGRRKTDASATTKLAAAGATVRPPLPNPPRIMPSLRLL